MIVRINVLITKILILIHLVKTDDFVFNTTDNTGKISNYTFKDYIEKFRPSFVWRDIEETNKYNGINKTMKDEFDTIFRRIDESDELLNLKVRNGEPKMLLQKDGRRWVPPGDVEKSKIYDPFSIRRRFLELMKQAIYQTRTKMVIMQTIRERYNKVSVYKMGFLIGKTDRACKTFSGFASKAFRACSLSREHAVTTHPILDILESHERLLDLWFDVELLVDLITINHKNCIRMLNQVLTNRKHAWKFID